MFQSSRRQHRGWDSASSAVCGGTEELPTQLRCTRPRKGQRSRDNQDRVPSPRAEGSGCARRPEGLRRQRRAAPPNEDPGRSSPLAAHTSFTRKSVASLTQLTPCGRCGRHILGPSSRAWPVHGLRHEQRAGTETRRQGVRRMQVPVPARPSPAAPAPARPTAPHPEPTAVRTRPRSPYDTGTPPTPGLFSDKNNTRGPPWWSRG